MREQDQMRGVFKIVSATERKAMWEDAVWERKDYINEKYSEQKPLGFVRKRTRRWEEDMCSWSMTKLSGCGRQGL